MLSSLQCIVIFTDYCIDYCTNPIIKFDSRSGTMSELKLRFCHASIKPILIKFSAAAAQCMNWALVFNLWPFWIIKMHSKELMLLFFSVKTEPSTAADPPMDKTTVFYIAVGVACGIILIMALAVAAIHVHSMPSPNKEGLVGLLEGLSCFDPFYRVHCSDHQASNYNSLSTVRHKFFTSSSPSPRFPKLLEFPPLRISRFKELPPPPHTHTHTLLDYVTCLNVLRAAAEGAKNEVNFLLFPVIHSTLEDVKFKQKLYTHLHLIWTKTLFLVNATIFFPLCLQWNWWWRWTS